MSKHGPDDVIIAVMGATGAGKTSFLNTVAGSSLPVGHGLISKTETVQLAEFRLGGRLVQLIDTPGFDDTNKSDTEVLTLIATHLAVAYRNQRRLTGLLYLHRITDNRVGGVSYRNMKMFHKLCGDDALKNVLLCTTMWSKVAPEEGVQREEELRSNSKFWKDMLDKGASIIRYNGTKEDGLEILSKLMSLGGMPPLQIQREIVDEKKTFIQTAAGAHINADLLRREAEHKAEIEEIKADFAQAVEKNNAKLQQEINKERKKTEQQLADIQKEKDKLVASQAELQRKIREAEDRLNGDDDCCVIC